MGKYGKLDFSKFKEEFKEKEKKKSFDDERFWKFTYDKATQKGSAIIRFLPDPSGIPFVKFCQHFFKYQVGDTTKYYTKKCRTSVAEYDDCPVCVKNTEYFKSIHEADKAIFQDRKRKWHYVANVKVIKDADKPETEGNIYLFDFGPQLFQIYSEAMFGPEGYEDMTDEEKEDIDIFAPCDFDEGADFVLRAAKKKNSKWVSYETSKFKKQTTMFDDLEDDEREEAIEELMGKTFSIEEWTEVKNYPKAEEVLAELGSILGKLEVEHQEDESEYLDDDSSNDETSGEEDSSEEVNEEDYLASLAN